MSLQLDKTDYTLGENVEGHLKKLGLNTPMVKINSESDQDKIDFIRDHIHQCLVKLGLDMNDDSLVDTPNRIAKMWVKELFWGLNTNNFPKITTVDNKLHYNEMVTEKNISVMSNCEHHFVTIDGVAHVSYIPKEKVIGLSKLNRVVEYYARRPQIQERLTMQIGEALKYILGTDDIAVVIDAVHYCVKSRGVSDQNSSTTTTFLSGAYKNKETRKELFDTIKG